MDQCKDCQKELRQIIADVIECERQKRKRQKRFLNIIGEFRKSNLSADEICNCLTGSFEYFDGSLLDEDNEELLKHQEEIVSHIENESSYKIRMYNKYFMLIYGDKEVNLPTFDQFCELHSTLVEKYKRDLQFAETYTREIYFNE